VSIVSTKKRQKRGWKDSMYISLGSVPRTKEDDPGVTLPQRRPLRSYVHVMHTAPF